MKTLAWPPKSGHEDTRARLRNGRKLCKSLYSPLKGRKPRLETELRACKTLSQTISNSYPDSSLYSMQTEWTERGGLQIVSRAGHITALRVPSVIASPTTLRSLAYSFPFPRWHFSLLILPRLPTPPAPPHLAPSWVLSLPVPRQALTPQCPCLKSPLLAQILGISKPLHSNAASLNLLFALLITFWAPQGLLTSFSVLGT